jgi:hypothetical protein
MESGCKEDSPECMCPCGCGCQNDPGGADLPFVDFYSLQEIMPGEYGLCASCGAGNHEIPPGDDTIYRLIGIHERILEQLKEVKHQRQIDSEV